jgi:hypothetical protein
MKIGVAGTHSTGKTTVLNFVADRLGEAGFSTKRVSDLASAARDAGFPILRDHTFASTLWIMTRGISEELAAALHCDVVLVDRPVPDALGYLFAALTHRGEIISEGEMGYLHALTKLHANTYDALFKTHPDPALGIADDKLRDRDSRFRVLAADGINFAFSKLTLPYIQLSVDPVEARTLVLDWLLTRLRARTL